MSLHFEGPNILTGTTSMVTGDIVRYPDRAAEVSRGHSRRRKRAGEAGGLTPLKARTDWSGK